MGNIGTIAAPVAGEVYRTNIAGAKVILGADINVPQSPSAFYVNGTGTFDFANYNVIWDGSATQVSTTITNRQKGLLAGPVNFTVASTASLSVGDNVTISGSTWGGLANGSYTISAIAGSTIQLTGVTSGFGTMNSAMSATLVDVTSSLPASVFSSAAAAKFLATDASTGGYLIYTNISNLGTNGALVPRIMISNGASVTLATNSGVSDIFSDFNPADATPVSGSLALGANNFTLAGGTWNVFGGSAYSGTGTMIITGPTNANLGGDITIPNLQLKNTTNTATLVDNDGAATVPAITVATLFTSTSGKLDFKGCDIILTNAGNVFTYADGAFAATTATGVAAGDNANGELVFNGNAQTLTLSADCSVPNVRVDGVVGTALTMGTASGKNLLVPGRFVFGAGQTVSFATAATVGNLAFGDGCWVERRVANPTGLVGGVYTPSFALLTKAPIFPTSGVIDLYYNLSSSYSAALAPGTSVTYTVHNEMPAAGTTLRGLYIAGLLTHTNTLGPVTTVNDIVFLNGSKNIQVNSLLHLISANYNPKPAATTYTFAMAADATVRVQDGRLLTNGTPNTFSLTGGPVYLEYTNTIARPTSETEYPATAGFAKKLSVLSLAVTNPALVLHADRSAVDFVLDSGEFTTPVNTVRFDLNGKTLTVTNTASAVLTRGVLSSEAVVGGVYVYGNLVAKGLVSSTANASIENVNVSAGTLNLAGSFGQVDWDGSGALTNVLPATVSSATVKADGTVANFNGDLTVAGNTTLNGTFTNGTITASKDVTVNKTGLLTPSSNLVFVGSAHANLNVQPGTTTIGALTFDKFSKVNKVTLVGGDLETTATTTFTNGLFVTNDKVFHMFTPLFGFGQGFVHNADGKNTISHVVGNVCKALVNGGGGSLGLNNSSEPRQEWPVGSLTAYSPAALTFNPQIGGLPTTPNAEIKVSYTDGDAGGYVGLPIANGVAEGIDIGGYPGFYWFISTTPYSIGPSTPFDMELTAGKGITYYDYNALRIIRRHGAVSDPTSKKNSWLFQAENDVPNPLAYDNSYNVNVPTVIVRGANAGLRTGGAIFTYGLRTKMKVTGAIAEQYLVKGDAASTFDLSKVFVGNVGTLKFTAQSDYDNYVTATVDNKTLSLLPVAVGQAIVTVWAQDESDNDVAAFSFTVNVGLVDVKVNDIPTEYALFQNYPNPFNPTTNIKFDLPKESNVTLKVYNILGAEVATLVNNVMSAGHQEVKFDASKYASGMYIYRLEAGSFVQVKKMLLMK
jgi:hypothetical protein